MTKKVLTEEERLGKALVPESEWPYTLPEGWNWVRLDYVADIITGGTPSKKKSEYYGGNFPFFKPADLGAGRNVFEASEYLSDQGKNVARFIPKHSTAVCCIGSIGKCGFLEVDGTTNQQINTAVPRIVDPLFLFYNLNSDFFKQQLLAKASSTTISIVNKSKMESTIFPLAPMNVQKQIVTHIESLFSKLDEAKEKVEATLESSELRKSAILHQAFIGELTKKWREENGVKLEDWKQVSLKDVCMINPKKISTVDLSDDLEVSFIPMPAVDAISGEVIDPQTRKLGEVKKGFTNFQEGDVVFAKITPCMENGKSAIIGKLINDIGYGTTEFYVFRCKPELKKEYLYHMIRDRNFRDRAQSVMTGAVGQRRVPKAYLQEYTLNLPSIEEQEEIISLLEKMLNNEDYAVEVTESVNEQIEMVKKAVLADAFRGKV